MAKLENLIKLISDDNAEYQRLRRRIVKLPSNERTTLEKQLNNSLIDIKNKLKR